MLPGLYVLSDNWVCRLCGEQMRQLVNVRLNYDESDMLLGKIRPEQATVTAHTYFDTHKCEKR